MSKSTIEKIILIIFYLIIIILVPLFLDYLLRITVRDTRQRQIAKLAWINAQKNNKPLIIFVDRYNGTIIEQNGKCENFKGDMVEIVDQMAKNSGVIIIAYSLEYLQTDIIKKFIDNLNRVSGGDLYILAIEKNSTRIFFDYKIKNIMNKSYYLPGDLIEWYSPNNLQKKIQKFYSYIFKILPYNFFTNDIHGICKEKLK